MHSEQAKPRTRCAAERAASQPYVLYHCHLALSAVRCQPSAFMFSLASKATRATIPTAHGQCPPCSPPTHTHTQTRQDETRRTRRRRNTAGTNTQHVPPSQRAPRPQKACCLRPSLSSSACFHRPSLGATSTTALRRSTHVRDSVTEAKLVHDTPVCLSTYCSTVTMSC
jgi:hypothetical protein